MIYDDLVKTRGTPENRQARLAKNGEAIERYSRVIIRYSKLLDKALAERKRLLNPRKSDKKAHDWMPDKYVGSGGGAVDSDLNDDLEGV
jgi:hypothetical protein